MLDHGDGTESVYGHLGRRSIRVKKGPHVVAGTQIASSGNSSWPHLHFTVRRDHAPYEPFAGPCREGSSGWADQPKIRPDTYVSNVTLSPNPFAGAADLPHDEAVRAGAFVRGRRDVHVRVELRNIGAGAIGTLSVRRPDGTTAVTAPLRVSGYRTGWAKRRLALQRAQLGRVTFCVVSTSLVNGDPTTTSSASSYRWRSGGRVVRSTTSAHSRTRSRGRLRARAKRSRAR